MTKTRLLVLFVVVLCAGVKNTPTRAQGTQSALAEALFEDAMHLMDAGKIDDACPKLEESFRLEALPGTLLRLALCHEMQNKTATAFLEFSRGLSWAERDGRQDRIAFARAHLEALRDQVPRLSIDVPPQVASLENVQIRLDDVVVMPSAWRTPTPVDPGLHVVKISAKGHEDTVREVRMAAGQNHTERLPMPRRLPSLPQPTPMKANAGPPVAAWVLGGAGVTALGVGAVFGWRAISRSKDAERLCGPGPACGNRTGLDANDEARRAALVSNISVGAGLLAVGVGAYLWWRGEGEASTSSNHVSLSLSQTTVGLVLGGGL